MYDMDDIQEEFQSIIRFKVVYKVGSNYISDTGWGCMVRVGQMALAQIMKKHLKNFHDKRDYQLDNIILAFADNDDGEIEHIEESLKLSPTDKLEQRILCPFSIQKISYLAKKEFNLNPGEWYKPNYILYILETLHNNFAIRGSEDLKMLVFNDSSLFMD